MQVPDTLAIVSDPDQIDSSDISGGCDVAGWQRTPSLDRWGFGVTQLIKTMIMLIRSNARPLAIITSYACLSILPFLEALSGAEMARTAVASICLWSGLWGVCNAPARFHWLLLPAFLLAPADIWLLVNYGQILSLKHWGIIAESNPGEMAEFLGSKLWMPVIAICLAFLWWWVISIFARRDVLSCSPQMRRGLLFVAAFFATGVMFGINAETDLTRPLGIYAQGVQFATERNNLPDAAKRFSFGAHSRDPPRQPTAIVLVIGESSRSDRWSLNGYARQTNPLLAAEANLVSFSDAVSPVSATVFSVPVLLTRKRAVDAFRPGFPEKSVVTAFREAGFETWWISNQIALGGLNTPITQFAREADKRLFLNPGSFSDAAPFDEILLDPLARALASSQQPKFIVLHTLGSHWNYGNRYPLRFERWRPALGGVSRPDENSVGQAVEISNSYDNSILYSDWLLSRIIASLKQSGRPSAMMYVADHGENLVSRTCPWSKHGQNSIADFKVPLVTWISDSYASLFPMKAAALREHRDAPLSLENIFPSIVDLGDVRHVGRDDRRSIASAQFTNHPRYVDSYGWADFDNARLEGGCAEVVDKRSPLPRSSMPFAAN